MSFDLTNKNIQDTFQNLLQKTGSDGRLFDLEGNQVNDLTLTNLSASGHISAAKFIKENQISTIFRFHDFPDMDKIISLQ